MSMDELRPEQSADAPKDIAGQVAELVELRERLTAKVSEQERELTELRARLVDQEHLRRELEEEQMSRLRLEEQGRIRKEREREAQEAQDRLREAHAALLAAGEKERGREQQLEEAQAQLHAAKQEIEAGQKLIQAQRQELKETQDELSAARRSAQKASGRVKSDYLNSMGHSIQASMNTIMEASAHLAESFLDAEQEKYVSSLWQSASMLLGMLNNILEISEIEAGTLKLNPTSFDPRQTLAGVAETAREHTEAKSLVLNCEIDPRSPQRVIGDEERIRLVLLELMENAVKHTSSGRIQLSLDFAEEANGTGRLRFAVRDSGEGLSAQQLETVFDAPPQPQGVSAMGGTHSRSLSLPLAKQLVALMGGRMDAESREGDGTTFYFDLRLQVIEPAQRADKVGKELVGEPA